MKMTKEQDLETIAKHTIKGLTAKNEKIPSNELAKIYFKYKHAFIPSYKLPLKHPLRELVEIAKQKNIKSNYKDFYINLSENWEEKLIDTFNTLSKETKEELRKNYNVSIVKDVITAILDFEWGILSYESSKKKHFSIKKSDPKIKYKKIIAACDTIINNVSLSKLQIEMIKAIKHGHEEMLSQSQNSVLTPIMEAQLNKLRESPLYNESVKTKSFNERIVLSANWATAFYSEINKIVFKLPVGTPQKLFSKTLQIVIYEILNEAKHKKNWTMNLTASIINEAYKDLNLPKLTAKDIENSLHSS